MTTDLDMLTIPGPIVTELTAPFWEAAQEGRLVIQACEDCGKAVFYPRAMCPHCWSNRVKWRDACGRGRLKSFSVVSKPGHPGWSPAAPYVVGLVELEEGPTMLSHIMTPYSHFCVVGEALELAPTRIGGRMLPAFRPVSGESQRTDGGV